MSDSLDIAANRATRKYTSGEMLRRILWMLAQPLYRFSPRPCFGWRRFLLRCFGARLAPHVHLYNSATVYYPWNLEVGEWSALGEHVFIYNLGPVKIGARATLSLGAKVCAGSHDHTRADLPLLKPPITIGDQAWICADAFVGPGVTVGEGAVVGARAVVVKDVAPWTIVAGNPAREVKQRVLTSSSGERAG
jgi:putative colanic acid biosynthesis acetyltransferase WcaF